jgi:hypothetical protein
LFAVSGVLAVVGVANDTRQAPVLLVIAAADLGVAALVAALPWRRWRPHAPAALALPAFAVLGFSTWALGGVAAGTGPFLVLIYAWVALHFPRWVLFALTLPALAAYLTPLIVTGQPASVLGSAMVLMPVALGVALLIEAQGRHLRDDRERLARTERWRAALVAADRHPARPRRDPRAHRRAGRRADRRRAAADGADHPAGLRPARPGPDRVRRAAEAGRAAAAGAGGGAPGGVLPPAGGRSAGDRPGAGP